MIDLMKDVNGHIDPWAKYPLIDAIIKFSYQLPDEHRRRGCMVRDKLTAYNADFLYHYLWSLEITVRLKP